MDMDWPQISAHPPLWILLMVAFLGTAIGSFLTLVTYRLPRDEKIGMTRSRCPSCTTTLTPPDLVPVFSWLFSRARCRHCKNPVSIRYPLTELACGLGALLAVVHGGLTLEALAITGLWWSVVAIVVTDLEHYIILDEVQIAIGFFGILYGCATDRPYTTMAMGAATGAALGLALKYGFLYLRKKDGLGMGGIVNFVPFLFFSGILGIVSGIGWRLLGLGERFPFGPALAAALFLCVVFPHAADQFWQLYGWLPSK